MEVKILFGSQTGNAERLAFIAKTYLESFGFGTEIIDMKDAYLRDLKKFSNILLITSTWLNGDPPDNAEYFYDELSLCEDFKIRKIFNLSNLNYSVFALGQRCFEHFCKAGIDFDKYLARFKAKRLLPLEKSDNNFDKNFLIWLEKVKKELVKIEEKDGRKYNFRRMETKS